MSEHTRIPWKVTVPPSSCLTTRFIESEAGEHICKVGHMDYGHEDNGIDVANADLIVLAVNCHAELLESLRDMIDEAESLRVEYNEVRCVDGYPEEPAAKCVDQARAVIAKVEALQ